MMNAHIHSHIQKGQGTIKKVDKEAGGCCAKDKYESVCIHWSTRIHGKLNQAVKLWGLCCCVAIWEGDAWASKLIIVVCETLERNGER